MSHAMTSRDRKSDHWPPSYHSTRAVTIGIALMGTITIPCPRLRANVSAKWLYTFLLPYFMYVRTPH